MPYLQDMSVLMICLQVDEVINKNQPLKSFIVGSVEEKSTHMIENQRHVLVSKNREPI